MAQEGPTPLRDTQENRQILFCRFCEPETIATLPWDPAFVGYAAYKPIVAKKSRLIAATKSPDANVTLAVGPKGTIVAVAILEYPQPDERWVRVGERVMMEVSVIEVARSWRGKGVAKRLLAHLLDHPLLERRIVYMVGYSWTWDLEGGRLPAIGYRDILVRLFEAHGFRIFQTNEPNVMVRPENLFMARVGAEISGEATARFKRVRFNLEP